MDVLTAVADQRLYLSLAMLVIAMLISAVISWRYTRFGAVVLLLISLAWFKVSQGAEGHVFLVVIAGRAGMTTSDLVGVAGVLVALGLFARGSRPHRG